MRTAAIEVAKGFFKSFKEGEIKILAFLKLRYRVG